MRDILRCKRSAGARCCACSELLRRLRRRPAGGAGFVESPFSAEYTDFVLHDRRRLLIIHPIRPSGARHPAGAERWTTGGRASTLAARDSAIGSAPMTCHLLSRYMCRPDTIMASARFSDIAQIRSNHAASKNVNGDGARIFCGEETNHLKDRAAAQGMSRQPCST